MPHDLWPDLNALSLMKREKTTCVEQLRCVQELGETSVGMKVAAHKVRDAVWIIEEGGLLVTLCPICCLSSTVHCVACSVSWDGLLCCEALSVLLLMLDGSDSGLTVSRYVWNFEVCPMEQEPLEDLCTCGAPTPQ